MNKAQFLVFLDNKQIETSHQQRIDQLFRDYGPHLTEDLINVLLHAEEQGKLDEVLPVLELHFNRHLSYQHPEIRGLVQDGLLHVNPTEKMFLDICTNVLRLSPVAA